MKYSLLVPEYIEDRQALLLCKKIIQFVRIKHYWPTVRELHKKFVRGCNYSLSACVYYTRVAIQKGYIQYDPWNHLMLTDAYYKMTHTEVIEPPLPSHPLSRKKVLKYKNTLSREHKTLKELGYV